MEARAFVQSSHDQIYLIKRRRNLPNFTSHRFIVFNFHLFLDPSIYMWSQTIGQLHI